MYLEQHMSGSSIVIIGAGHAGTEAAFAMRQEGIDGPVTLINGEEMLPYQRPPLSKSFMQHGVAAPLRSADAYIGASIDIVRARVKEIDRARRTLRLDHGESLRYDHLVLAVGTRPNRLVVAEGLDLPNLNDLQSAERLRNMLPQAHRVAIIGAGFIGMEFAAAAAALGKQVVVVGRSARVLEQATSAEVSSYLEERNRSRGVEIMLGADVAEIRRHGSASYQLTLSSGMEINANLVVEAVGAVPRLELASQAGLRTDTGIVADGDLLTSDPRISVMGDCAQFPYGTATLGTVLTSVQNAADQARHVAKWLSGARAPYAAVPWFWSDQADDKLQIVGIVPRSADRVTRRSRNRRSFSVFSFQNDVLVSVETLNSPADHMTARRLLRANVSIRQEQAGDPDFDLKSLFHQAQQQSAA